MTIAALQDWKRVLNPSAILSMKSSKRHNAASKKWIQSQTPTFALKNIGSRFAGRSTNGLMNLI